MRNHLIIALLLWTSHSFSQDTKYKNGTMSLILQDEQANVIAENPFAKDVTVTYDIFFKSYTVKGTFEGGESEMKFRFVKNLSDGWKRYEYDNSSTGIEYYIVTDRISNDGILFLVNEKHTFNKSLNKMVVTCISINDLEEIK